MTNEPPSPYGWRLSLLLAWGEHEQARALLATINNTQRAFGMPDYTMPTPADCREGLITCPAVPYERQRIDECPENHRPRWAA